MLVFAFLVHEYESFLGEPTLFVVENGRANLETAEKWFDCARVNLDASRSFFPTSHSNSF